MERDYIMPLRSAIRALALLGRLEFGLFARIIPNRAHSSPA